MIDSSSRRDRRVISWSESTDAVPLCVGLNVLESPLSSSSPRLTAPSWSHQVHSHRSKASNSESAGAANIILPIGGLRTKRGATVCTDSALSSCDAIHQADGSSYLNIAAYQPVSYCRMRQHSSVHKTSSCCISDKTTTTASAIVTTFTEAANKGEEEYNDYYRKEAMPTLSSLDHSSRHKLRRRRRSYREANRVPPITYPLLGNRRGFSISSRGSSSLSLLVSFAALGLLLLLSNCLDLLSVSPDSARLGFAQADVNLTPNSKSITISATVGGVSSATTTTTSTTNVNNNKSRTNISKSSNNNNNNYYSRHNVYTRDEESDQPPATQLPNVDDPSIFNEIENSTQIPLEPQGSGSRGSINNNKRLAYSSSTAAATTTSTRRPSSGSSSKRPVLQVTETELLPFSDFNVHQPAFSDLIRSYPPTNQQQQQQQQRRRKPTASQQSLSSNQQQHRYHLHHQGYQPQWSHGGVNEALDDEEADNASSNKRNHLNEDLDDTAASADESFERDQLAEPPTWINYLADLGDLVFTQLRRYFEESQSQATNQLDQSSASDSATEAQKRQQSGQLPIEMIDEILDDYYYDQYENSQVLYYGAQLVREGDIFEIGCYLPSEHKAEWTKSGRLLNISSSSPRVIRRTDFLSAKQNLSLKVFEASLTDTGNYRCDQMSRKYHKLVVVPRKISTTQLYLVQQRLLSIVNPNLMSANELGLPTSKLNINHYIQLLHTIAPSKSAANQTLQSIREQLLPGYLIVEHHPLVVNCNISDEFVLRRLRDTPTFQLAWFKNGKQLRGQVQSSTSPLSQSTNNLATRMRYQQSSSLSASHLMRSAGARIQFLGPNGRQLYISSAQNSDAGEYLCSWSKLPVRQTNNEDYDPAANASSESANSPAELDSGHQASGATISNNLLAAGRLVQLTVPVKLRPFRSTYHVRQGNELRILCQAARGYPAAHISWYVGNRLVDTEFLREHGRDFRIVHLHSQNQVVVTSDPSWSSSSSSQGGESSEERQIVEINPIPASRQQMQLTSDGRGQWVEYRDGNNEKYSLETSEQQLRYMKQKLAQLSGVNSQSTGRPPAPSSSNTAASDMSVAQNGDPSLALLGQTSLSMLVIKSLDTERHTSRYACRATTRANTDEVTTVIQVEASRVRAIKPTTGRATLIPGQDLNFQCGTDEPLNYQYIWYKRNPGTGEEERLEPNDDTVEIHNERLTLHKPNVNFVGDYVCTAIKDEYDNFRNESAVIQVRTLPYIEDFGLDTSHTGKSGIITDGERLELTCTISDTSQPVNITWLRSMTPDEERTMVPLPDTPKSALPSSRSLTTTDPLGSIIDEQTFIAPDQNIIVERLSNHSKRLVIESVSQEHRSYYVCMADNGITERTRKIIFIRVKDKLVALWPFLGIVAELFILFTIIHIWETQRAYKEVHAVAPSATSPTGSKRPASGASVAFESVPLTRA